VEVVAAALAEDVPLAVLELLELLHAVRAAMVPTRLIAMMPPRRLRLWVTACLTPVTATLLLFRII
jgi:hypothetical protein